MAGPGRVRTRPHTAPRARLGAAVFAALAMLVGGALVAPAALAANPPLQVTTTTLPPGNVATPYAVALTATGGELPWTWSIASGSLPDGLTVDLGGIVSGTPTVSGTFLFTAKVTDGVGATATKPLSITINPQLTITTAALPHGVAGVPYSRDARLGRRHRAVRLVARVGHAAGRAEHRHRRRGLRDSVGRGRLHLHQRASTTRPPRSRPSRSSSRSTRRCRSRPPRCRQRPPASRTRRP